MLVWPQFEPFTNLISSGQIFKEQLNHKAGAQHPVNEIHPFTQEILMSLLCLERYNKSEKASCNPCTQSSQSCNKETISHVYSVHSYR